MNFRRNQGGFIFSLDATLAMLVVIIVMAGVARVAGPELIYEQHGYLRLERYANDALEVSQIRGTLDSIVNYTKHGYPENAENLAGTELRKILPKNVQFRLVIGDEANPRLDNVYPSAGKHAEWYAAFSNAKEKAVAVRISTLPPKKRLKILIWLDAGDEYEENFVRELIRCTNWENKSTSNVDDFWWEVNLHNLGTKHLDVVFLPDAQDLATEDDMIELVKYQQNGGRVVVGGETLYNNSQTEGDNKFWRSVGVVWPGGAPNSTSGQPLDNMHIINGDNFVTRPYENCDNIEYNENHLQYVYTPIDDEWVVAQWEETPEGMPSPLPGIIVREAGYTSSLDPSLTYPEPAVLFNMRFVRSAMDPIEPRGTMDWITLVRRATGYEEVFEPIILYVWRGPGV